MPLEQIRGKVFMIIFGVQDHKQMMIDFVNKVVQMVI
jgi:hypothetical protein